MTDDQEQLRLLSIFHYVLSGIAALVGCVPFIHLAVGIAILTGHFPEQPNKQFSDAMVGYFFVGAAVFAIMFQWTLALCLWLTALFLRQRRHYTFCLIMAGVQCLFFPFGTALGVFTIIVLNRPSVKTMFNGGEPAFVNPPPTE